MENEEEKSRKWRLSVRKSLGRVAKVAAGHVRKKPPQAWAAAKMSGISLKALMEIHEGILNETIAKDLKLYVLSEDVEQVKAGTTVKFTRKLTREEDKFIARAPRRSRRLQVPVNSVIVKPRTEWTLNDVCEFVVLAETAEDNSFFLDCIDSADVGEPYQGAFIIHSHDCSFSRLVKSLENHYIGKGDKSQIFLWIDVFSLNLPVLFRQKKHSQKEYFNDTLSALESAIENFDSRLLFVDSWGDPSPLERAWCVMELLIAARKKLDLTVLVSGDRTEVALTEAMADAGCFSRLINIVSLENMKCRDELDRQDILAKMENEEEGFKGALETVTVRLQRWVVLWVEDVVKEMVSLAGDTPKESLSDMLLNAGKVMVNLGQIDVGLSYFAKAGQILVDMYETDSNLKVAAVYNCMAVALDDRGDLEKALSFYEKALSIRQTLCGENHKDTAGTYNNIATVYRALGRYDEALVMFEKALKVKIAVLGERHPSTAGTYNNLGLLFMDQGKTTAALEMFYKALDIFQADNGTHDASVANTLFNIALIFDDQEELDKALEMYEGALAIFKRTSGGRHRSTAETILKIGLLLEAKGDDTSARDCATAALSIFQEIEGPTHRNTNKAKKLYRRSTSKRSSSSFRFKLSSSASFLSSSSSITSSEML